MTLKPEEIHVIIEGRVQGVGFRWATQKFARDRGLRGWVRNLPDGTVETTAQGSAEQIDGFLGWLSQGPTTADVIQARVLRREAATSPLPERFDILT